MKSPKSALTLAVFVAIAALLCYAAYAGVGEKKQLGVENIKLGLDLKGGVNIVFEADKEDPSSAEMKTAISLLRGRLDRKGETESEVTIQGNNRIRVDIPGYQDAEEAVNTIGQTAQLFFADEQGNVILDGTMVKNAVAGTQKNQVGLTVNAVNLEFTDEGAVLFEEATGNNVGKPIYILLDNDILSAPVVNQKISGGKCYIESNNMDAKEANELAELIKAGSLPFDLKVLSMTNVGARLGANALETSIKAGLIGFALILLLMLFVYKLSGLAADLALFIYLGLDLVILSLFGITLTLPGIAGIVLSVGMAVDANIIIFERMKDELASGKTLRASCEAGFKRALPAIIDSNITTIIAAIILFWLGTGPVKGFAQTLGIGIVISMFTAIIVTRTILKSIIGMGVTNVGLFGGKLESAEVKEPKIKIASKRKLYFMISGIAIAAGCVFMFINMSSGKGAFDYDVEFTGGTEMTVDIGQAFENSDITTLITEAVSDAAPQVQKVVGTNQVSIKMKSLDSEGRTAVMDALKAKYGIDESVISVADISAAISSEMKTTAVLAVVVACIAMLIYISLRFKDIRTGGSAIIALVHDSLLVILAYAVFRIPLSYSFIAVMLTILGYSINATIVIFDRVRENRKRISQRNLEALVDTSINQTFKRCIYTSLAVLIMAGCLYAFGVTSIKDFTLPIIVGVVWGTYSSIFISGSVYYVLSKPKTK